MIDACVKCGKFEEAYLLYEEVAQRGHNLDAVGIGMVVNALTNSGMIVNSLVDQPYQYIFIVTVLCMHLMHVHVMQTSLILVILE